MTTPACPRCPDTPLRSVSMGGAPAHSCPRCGGHAVRRAALAKAADPGAVARLWSALASADRPGPLACPACAGPMQTTHHGGVELDACPACALLWFDPKERRAAVRPRPARALDPAALAFREQQAQAPPPPPAPAPADRTPELVEGLLQLLAGLLG